jgi:Ca-activated chloride channel family protein
MGGEKISLLKSTMKYLLDTLTPEDRLSIITFEDWGEVLCGLTSVNSDNKSTIQRHVDSLSGRGGTNICSGLDLALKTIK